MPCYDGVRLLSDEREQLKKHLEKYDREPW